MLEKKRYRQIIFISSDGKYSAKILWLLCFTFHLAAFSKLLRKCNKQIVHVWMKYDEYWGSLCQNEFESMDFSFNQISHPSLGHCIRQYKLTIWLNVKLEIGADDC